MFICGRRGGRADQRSEPDLVSEQTGVMESTLRTHYGRFIHASHAAALELAKIDPKDGKKEKFAPRRSKLEEKSFELQEKDGG